MKSAVPFQILSGSSNTLTSPSPGHRPTHQLLCSPTRTTEKAFALSLPQGPWQIFLTSLDCLSLLQDRQLLPPVQVVLNTSRQAVMSVVPRPAAQHLLGT